MTEISIFPLGGLLTNLTWEKGVKTSSESPESVLDESGILKNL